MTPQQIVDRLDAHGCAPRGSEDRGWLGRCPAHEDDTASLSIGVGDDGRTLLNCFAGCTPDQIVEALGLTLTDLFQGTRDQHPEARTRRSERPAEPLPDQAQLDAWSTRLAGHSKMLARLTELKGWTPEVLTRLGVGFDGERLTFPIRNAHGELVNVSRYKPTGEPKMLAVRGRPRDLFPAPESIDAETVWLVEGEPDAISLTSAGLDAAAVPGAQAWRSSMASRFKDRQVVVCCDCDAPGRKLAQQIAHDLGPVAGSVRVVDLDAGRSDGYDVGDLVATIAGPRDHLERAAATVVTANGLKTPTAARITLQWASDVTPERIEWLWTDRLPLHDLAVLAGEPGLGKSTTTAELAARITRGELSGAIEGKPHSILVATAEDHFESVVWGRLSAAGADLARVANVIVSDGLLAIPEDVDALGATCSRLRQEGRPAALIVVDPISAYLGGVDSHKDAAVRGALAPLAKLAQTERVCVLAVAHLNKSSAGQLLSRISGSGAFGAAPRSVLAFARDPDDQDGEQGRRRVIVHAKSNHGRYAPTLAVHIDAVMVEEVAATVSRLVIDGETDVGPEDLRPGGGDQSSGEDVRDAIVDALTGGQRPSREVKIQVAGACGVSARTVERAAAKMVQDEELEQRREGQPPIGIWALSQLRHASCDTAVATGLVATGNPQYSRAISGVADPSSDTRRDMSLLGDLAPLEGESYEGWEARLERTNGNQERAA